LDFSGLPRFADLKPEHVTPAMDQLLAEGRATVAAVMHAADNWNAFVAPLEDANERIGRAWGQVSHLHAVLDSPPLREAYNANRPVTKPPYQLNSCHIYSDDGDAVLERWPEYYTGSKKPVANT